MNQPLILPMMLLRLLLAIGLCLACVRAGAVEPAPPRDPMTPPPASRTAAPAADAAAASAPPPARHLMVIDGRRYVIDGGRRRAVGDLLGSARIERIDDSAVLVRQDGTLQRLPLYGDVVRRPLPETDTATALARPAPPGRPARPDALAPPERPARPKYPSHPGEPQ